MHGWKLTHMDANVQHIPRELSASVLAMPCFVGHTRSRTKPVGTIAIEAFDYNGASC